LPEVSAIRFSLMKIGASGSVFPSSPSTWLASPQIRSIGNKWRSVDSKKARLEFATWLFASIVCDTKHRKDDL
jgi:hypothetical protein